MLQHSTFVQETSNRTAVEELDWTRWDGVRYLPSAKDAIKCGAQLHPLNEASALLDPADKAKLKGHSFASLPWPSNVHLTSNFLYATSQQSCLAGCMRLPAMMLAFKDGSLLVISEREAEYITRALASTTPFGNCSLFTGSLMATCPPVLLHFEYARSALPPREPGVWPTIPFASGTSLPDEAWSNVALGVLALQIFAGDTSYQRHMCKWYRLSSKKQDMARLRLVRSVLFGAGVTSCISVVPENR
jgi:hypothetical protein